MVLWGAYSAGCIAVLRLCRHSNGAAGQNAALLAIVANVMGIALNAWVRAWLAPLVLAAAAFAASRVFAEAGEARRDTDEERALSKAAMALVALALAEAVILLIAGFIAMMDV